MMSTQYAPVKPIAPGIVRKWAVVDAYTGDPIRRTLTEWGAHRICGYKPLRIQHVGDSRLFWRTVSVLLGSSIGITTGHLAYIWTSR